MADPGLTQPIDRSVLDALLSLGDGDSAFVLELIDLYLDDSAQRVQALTTAIDASDLATVERAAHALKSASANVGALALAEVCKETEMRARARAPVEEVAPIVRRVGDAYATAIGELRRIRGEMQT